MLGAAYLLHVRIQPQDVAAYEKFYNESKELRTKTEFDEKQPAVQYRENVRKEIWAARGNERLPLQLTSDRSELTLIQKKGSVQAIERLQGIDGWIQERADAGSSVQELRRFQAAEGSYSYPSHQFSAGSVQVGFYRVPGEGIVQKASFSVPFATAAADEVRFDPQNGETLTLKGNFQVHSPLGQIAAGRAEIDPFDLRKKTYRIHLDQNVKIKDGVSLSISSEKADCTVHDLSVSLLSCDELRFEGDVVIKKTQADREMTAQGGCAIYQKGFAALYPAPSSLCRVTQGDTEILAEKIDFDFENEQLICKLPEGEWHSERLEGPIRFSAEGLIGQRNELTLENTVKIWQDGLFWLEADRGTVSLDPEGSPSLATLQGGVRMLSTRIDGKESFALADTIVYHPLEKTATLSCEAPNKVLFWQEGLRLSATEIKIAQSGEKGPEPLPASIAGIGDVRFSFNLEEEDSIQNLIGKYKGLR